MDKLLALLLVGLSVGLSNFAASIAIGLSGISKSLRIKIALVFGLFETGMPILGLVLGQQIADKLGGHANLIGGGLLGLTGAYIIITALRQNGEDEVKVEPGSTGRLLLTGLSLSIDNLIVGFSLGTRHLSLPLAAAVIGITSVTLSLAGLELGRRLGVKVEEYSELLAGGILILVGLAIGLSLI